MDTPTRFRDYHSDQLMLLPPDLREWLPKDHKAYFILDIIGKLDLSSIYGFFDGSRRGQPPYDPRMMVGLLLYAYCEGITNSRKVERATYDSVAFGGAGPLHAAALAKALHIRTVLVPPSPGVTTALGLLVTDLRHDYVRTYISKTDELDLSGLSSIYREFEENGTRLLLSEGVSQSNIRFIREADMRYTGQSYELRVPVGRLSENLPRKLNAAFFTAHRRQYGFATRDETTEIVNVRLSAVGAVPRPSRRQLPRGKPSAHAALKAERDVHMPGSAGRTTTAIYDRYRLKANNRFPGPAIVEEIDSTTLIPPGCTVNVDNYGNLVIDLG